VNEESTEKVATRSSGRRILVIDDETVVCLSCSRILSEDGHEVDYRTQAAEGLKAALEGEHDIILLDLVMPDMNGLAVLEQLKASGVRAEVVVITGHATVETAVHAMRTGAADYVSKPFAPAELRLSLGRVFERSELIRENVALRELVRAHNGLEGIIGVSRAMERTFGLLKRVAPTLGTVLVTGESGTGKEVVARAIHRLSSRRSKALMAFDCSALAPTLLETELFGHVKGSFSGAIATKKGLFEAAHGGTVFLDEVGNLSLETQGKLLRVLETRMVRKVGDTREQEVDIRLISATSRDLQEMAGAGLFREDLYYRLNVFPINLPPLRERKGDIPHLATAFLERFQGANDMQPQRFTPEAMAALESYAWPGNVRELKNIVERMAILAEGEWIDIGHVPAEIRGSPAMLEPLPETWEGFKALKHRVAERAVRDLEQQFLSRALEQADGNVTRAADNVGMQRTQFHALLRRHGLGGRSA